MRIKARVIERAILLTPAVVNRVGRRKLGGGRELMVQAPPPPDIPSNVRVAMLPPRDFPNDCKTRVRMPTWPPWRDRPRPITTLHDLDPQTTLLTDPDRVAMIGCLFIHGNAQIHCQWVCCKASTASCSIPVIDSTSPAFMETLRSPSIANNFARRYARG